MPSTIGLTQQIQVGKEAVLPSDSPTGRYGAVFEDDGTTGYLYGIKFQGQTYDIVEALHIYNVSSVIDRDKPSTVQILWSEDGLKAALLINDYPHAVIDFENNKSFSRTNFPSPESNWTRAEWSDEALADFG